VVRSTPDIHRQPEVTEDGTHHAAAQYCNLKLNANLLCSDICNIGPKEFVQELEASFDSNFDSVALMEEEGEAAELAGDRTATDKAAEAESHVDLDDIMESNTIAEEVAQQRLDMFLLD
jgi:hypothetical protein